jgi:hypothetical protein
MNSLKISKFYLRVLHKITILGITDSDISKDWKSDEKLRFYIRYPT